MLEIYSFNFQVTFNYRLGIFGALTLDLPEYSGNMGLKDQRLAIKWVHENIEHFGGDKNKIGLVGHSSGAMCVGLHVMTSQSKYPMFQKAILMNGAALNPAIPRRYNHLEFLDKLGIFNRSINSKFHFIFQSCLLIFSAEELHYPISNPSDFIEMLNHIDANVLKNKTVCGPLLSTPGRKAINRIWNPNIENRNAIDPFMTASPFEILTNQSYENHIDTLFSISATVN